MTARCFRPGFKTDVNFHIFGSQFLGTLVAFLTWDVPHPVDDGKDDVDEHGQRSVSLFDTGRDFCWVIWDLKTPQV